MTRDWENADLVAEAVHEGVAHEGEVEAVAAAEDPVRFARHPEGPHSHVLAELVLGFHRHPVFRPAEGGGTAAPQVRASLTAETVRRSCTHTKDI